MALLFVAGCGSPWASDVRDCLQAELDTCARGGFRGESVSGAGCSEYVQNGVKGYIYSYVASIRRLKNSTLSRSLWMPRLASRLGGLTSPHSLKELMLADKGDVVRLEGKVYVMKTRQGWSIP